MSNPNWYRFEKSIFLVTRKHRQSISSDWCDFFFTDFYYFINCLCSIGRRDTAHCVGCDPPGRTFVIDGTQIAVHASSVGRPSDGYCIFYLSLSPAAAGSRSPSRRPTPLRYILNAELRPAVYIRYLWAPVPVGVPPVPAGGPAVPAGVNWTFPVPTSTIKNYYYCNVPFNHVVRWRDDDKRRRTSNDDDLVSEVISTVILILWQHGGARADLKILYRMYRL